MKFDPKLPHYFLKPGELFLSDQPAVVSTILGSCITVTLHGPIAGFGAMSHMLLPSGDIGKDFKYVDTTLHYMVEKIRLMGIEPRSCETKLFGGADILEKSGAADSTRLSIGRQNILEAERVLKDLGIIAKVSDVGGERGRRIFFNTSTGEVFVRKISKAIP